jgi:hypothetical protein
MYSFIRQFYFFVLDQLKNMIQSTMIFETKPIISLAHVQ